MKVKIDLPMNKQQVEPQQLYHLTRLKQLAIKMHYFLGHGISYTEVHTVCKK